MALTFVNDEGDEVQIPSKKELCYRCKGEGSVVNPSIGAITQSDRLDWADEDFMEDYISGMYDVACPECNGLRVIDVPDPERAGPTLMAAYERAMQEEADYWAMVAMEQAYGC